MVLSLVNVVVLVLEKCDVSLLFHGMTNLCWWHVVLPLNFGNCRGVGASTFDGVAWLCACIDPHGCTTVYDGDGYGTTGLGRQHRWGCLNAWHGQADHV
jgi:hypothetical protein